MTTLVSFERVLEVLDLEPTVADAAGRDGPAGRRRAVRSQLDHVRFRYPARRRGLAGLAGVRRDPVGARPARTSSRTSASPSSPGQLVALVGPSGAGKTTLSPLVTRMYDPTGGAVRVGGADLRDVTQPPCDDASAWSARRRTCSTTRSAANLRYASPEATDAELTTALRAAHIATSSARLPDGIDTVVGDRGYRLSGGERQRLAIARLLLKAPAIVILDEATAHLDSESEAAVQAALDEALVGRTSLVIAHRLSTVRQADSIARPGRGPRPSNRAPTTNSSPRAACTPTSTPPSSRRQPKRATGAAGAWSGRSPGWRGPGRRGTARG